MFYPSYDYTFGFSLTTPTTYRFNERKPAISSVYNYSPAPYNPATYAYTPYYYPVQDPLPSQTIPLATEPSKRKRTDSDSAPPAKKRPAYIESDKKCEVCHVAASGFHYGAYTCEACKLFFTRTAKKSRRERCPTRDCPITPTTRSHCSDCRYSKCTAVGMSLTGRSRYGRRRATGTNSIEAWQTLFAETKYRFVNVVRTAVDSTCLTSLQYLIETFYTDATSSLAPNSADSFVKPVNVACVVFFGAFFDVSIPSQYDSKLWQLEVQIKNAISYLYSTVTPDEATFSFKLAFFIYVIAGVCQGGSGRVELLEVLKEAVRSEMAVEVNRSMSDVSQNSSEASWYGAESLNRVGDVARCAERIQLVLNLFIN